MFGDVWAYVATNFKNNNVCAKATLATNMDKFVKENGENQLFTVNLKRPSLYLHQFMQGSGFVQPDMAGWVEEAKSLPSSVQYEKNLAYKGVL